MKLASKFKSVVSGVMAAAMMLTATSVMPSTTNVEAAGACTINTNKTYQRIRGFGGIDMQEWQGYTLSDAEKARAFGNGDGQLGLTVLRVYVNPNSAQWKLALPTAQYEVLY